MILNSLGLDPDSNAVLYLEMTSAHQNRRKLEKTPGETRRHLTPL
jgi:hypothetical protein